MRAAGTRAAALVALGLAAVALRLPFLVDYDEDIDALRFALAVDRFDVGTLRPHAPYYPVYVAAAKLVAALGATPRLALGLVGALAGGATVVLTALLARELAGRRAAAFAGAIALVAPFPWLASVKLTSDMAGVATFTAGLWLAARARRIAREGGAPGGLRAAALAVLGLALGVRLSYFPIALACLLVIAVDEGGARAWAARTRDLLTGVVAWLVPLVAVGHARDLVASTYVQGVGHFTRWGGSAITVPSPRARGLGMAWGLWANVLGGPWDDTPAWRWLAVPGIVALLVGGALAARPLREAVRAQPEVALATAAYVVWVAVGQNVAYKPRHLLPLAPVLFAAMGAGVAFLATRGRAVAAATIAAAGTLLVVWAAEGVGLARAHLAPSPAAAVVRFVRDGGATGRPVATCELARMIEEGAPGRPIVRPPSEAALAEAAAAGALVTSECASAAVVEALRRRGLAVRTAFARPRSRYVDSLWSELALVEAVPTE